MNINSIQERGSLLLFTKQTILNIFCLGIRHFSAKAALSLGNLQVLPLISDSNPGFSRKTGLAVVADDPGPRLLEELPPWRFAHF
jgi:hypothetical protein